MAPTTNTRRPHSDESGFMLVAVIVMCALVLIALSVAAPVMARSIRRDKEVESMHRAEQYVRAIRLYQRKFKNQYPPSIEALEKTNNVRYLRKQYVDPLTGKPDWRIIHVGENKTSVKVFFGQPLAGIDSKGLGGGLGSASGLASTTGGSTAPCTPATPSTGGTNGLAAGFAGASAGGTSGNCGSGASSGTIGAGNDSNSKSAFGTPNGAGPIMGVGSSRSGDSILSFNEQSTYDTWEFLYDPRIELLYQQGQNAGNAPGSSLPAAPKSTLDTTNPPTSTPNKP